MKMREANEAVRTAIRAAIAFVEQQVPGAIKPFVHDALIAAVIIELHRDELAEPLRVIAAQGWREEG
jgi:hypothetical protein